MTTYYCDLTADFVAGRDGTDNTAELLTGPAGFQIAIRGGGGASGEFKTGGLVPGDEILLYGIGLLTRLVLIDCNGTDVSAWEIGDTVRNNTGSGDHWTGKVVQERDNVATGLTADDVVLVQLDASATLSSVDDNKADGIENTTKAETSAISSVSAPGIHFDTGAPDSTNTIAMVGVNSSYIEDGSRFTLEAGGDATYCFYSVNRHYGMMRNFVLQNATSDGFQGSTYPSSWLFVNFIVKDNGGTGFCDLLRRPKLFQGLVSGNSGDGFDRIQYGASFVGVTIEDNGGKGIDGLATNLNFVSCVIHNNTGDGLYSTAGACLVYCVLDGKNNSTGGHGLNLSLGSNLIIGCRFTHFDASGKAGINSSAWGYYDYCAFFDNTTNVLASGFIAGLHNDTTLSDDGYVDRSSNDFNIVEGKEIRSEAMEIPS